jgi:hypothetical protein
MVAACDERRITAIGEVCETCGQPGQGAGVVYPIVHQLRAGRQGRQVLARAGGHDNGIDDCLDNAHHAWKEVLAAQAKPLLGSAHTPAATAAEDNTADVFDDAHAVASTLVRRFGPVGRRLKGRCAKPDNLQRRWEYTMKRRRGLVALLPLLIVVTLLCGGCEHDYVASEARASLTSFVTSILSTGVTQLLNPPD